jgi:hypothetical protein
MNDNITLTPKQETVGALMSELGHRAGNAESAALVVDMLLTNADYELPEGTSWLTSALVTEAVKAKAAYEELRDHLRKTGVMVL